jgi:hypothetical protein
VDTNTILNLRSGKQAAAATKLGHKLDQTYSITRDTLHVSHRVENTLNTLVSRTSTYDELLPKIYEKLLLMEHQQNNTTSMIHAFSEFAPRALECHNRSDITSNTMHIRDCAVSPIMRSTQHATISGICRELRTSSRWQIPFCTIAIRTYQDSSRPNTELHECRIVEEDEEQSYQASTCAPQPSPQQHLATHTEIDVDLRIPIGRSRGFVLNYWTRIFDFQTDFRLRSYRVLPQNSRLLIFLARGDLKEAFMELKSSQPSPVDLCHLDFLGQNKVCNVSELISYSLQTWITLLSMAIRRNMFWQSMRDLPFRRNLSHTYPQYFEHRPWAIDAVQKFKLFSQELLKRYILILSALLKDFAQSNYVSHDEKSVELFHDIILLATTLSPQLQEVLADSLRLHIEHITTYIMIQSRMGYRLAQGITAEVSKAPIGKMLLSQDKSIVATGLEARQRCVAHFKENDRLMLEDKEGQHLREALTEGLNPEDISFSSYNRTLVDSHNPLINFLSLCKTFKDAEEIANRGSAEVQDLILCCINRLTILLRAGFDPREYQIVGNHDITVGLNVGQILSPVQYSLCCGVFEELREALQAADWTEEEISNLVEDGYWIGFPELLDGSVTYELRSECRAEFEHKLRHGHLRLPGKNDMSMSMKIIARRLGSSCPDVMATIGAAYHAFVVKSLPGAWRNFDEEVTVVPGVDFEMSVWDKTGEWMNEKWINCHVYQSDLY